MLRLPERERRAYGPPGMTGLELGKDRWGTLRRQGGLARLALLAWRRIVSGWAVDLWDRVLAGRNAVGARYS